MSISAPRCSCIICHEEKSSKGIHSHYLTKHTLEGNERIKFAGMQGNKTSRRKIIKIIKYNNCLQCNAETINSKFCSKSCAAKFNNKLMQPKSRFKQSKTLKLTLDLKPKKIKNLKIIKEFRYGSFSIISYCVVCNSIIRNRKRKTCSNECLKLHLSNSASLRMSHPQNGKTILYKGIKLGSSYELKVAESLDENNIIWKKANPLKYQDPSGKFRRYFPDFYLPQYDVYLDPKNDFLINYVNPELGFNDCWKIKQAMKMNNCIVHVLNKNQLSWEYIKSLL